MRTLSRIRWLAVATFFGIQGLLCQLSRLQPWVPELPEVLMTLLGGLVVGWYVSVFGWLAMWLALHETRGWRMWLDTSLALAALLWPGEAWRWLETTYWTPPPSSPNDVAFTFDGTELNDLIAAVFTLLVMVSALTLVLARWLSGWRLVLVRNTLEPSAAQVSLRELMLGMLIFAGHVWIVQRFVLRVIAWDWHNLANWILTRETLRTAPHAICFSLMMLAAVRLALGTPWQSWRAVGLWLGSLIALAVIGWLMQQGNPPDMLQFLLGVVGATGGLTANVVFGSIYWRKLGWRVIGRGVDRHSENSSPA